MQKLTDSPAALSPRGPLSRRGKRSKQTDGRTGKDSGTRHLRLGIAGAVALVLVLLATGLVYVIPVGKSTYSADLTEAQSITTGSEVRIAGITVGKVTGLTLLPDRVRMRFTVGHNIFVGNRTTLDIRMLTVVGGHYVALTSAGDSPLGSTPIPADRVRLPYSLVRSLQDAATPISQVDAGTLRENLTAMQTSLAKSPDALRDMGRALQTLTSVLDRQRADVSRGLDVADEFLGALDKNRSLVGTFVRKMGRLETQGLAKKAEITEALHITGELLSRIAAIEPTWREALQPVAHKLTEAAPQMQQLIGKLDQSLAALQSLRDRLTADLAPTGGLSVDHSNAEIVAPGICIPTAGRRC
ncbi:MCE family protein [Nocardia sp. BSTN01]|uniref:MlaD family protein n=1 Tax=Nocardia sp. BSTN01 TaxID=2783665 RepID=UPI0018903DF5|nr:MlaD family protein [Nocardia sp. BSTN01]MBF5000519.1 MCE family protein [Nocardia sp. BSTN01]